MHIEWNDLQTIEALVRTGTVEGAARALGLTHPTISRRLAALEARLATSLFVRGARLVPTPLAREIAERAGAMQAAAADVEALVAAEQRRRDGRFVITTSDVLAPLLFRALAMMTTPLDVDVVVGDAELALGPGQIDLALRPGHDPADQANALRGRRLGQLQLGVFDVVRNARSDDDNRCWVLPDDALRARRSMRWWRHIPDGAAHVVTCNTLLAVRDACAAGLGRAVVPAFLFLDDPRVRRLRAIDDGPPLWLLSPKTAATTTKSIRTAVASALLAVPGAFVTR